MAKTIVEAKIRTRGARTGLPEGVHWREIDTGAHVHLGYRKGKRGGRWLVRWYQGDQKYRQETIGVADDMLEADGDNALNYDQAERTARAHVIDDHKRRALEAAGPVATVRSAVVDYVAGRDARESQKRGRLVNSDAHRLMKHVLCDDDLAGLPLLHLTKDRLVKWRKSLTGAVASRRRTANDLRAALNAAAPDALTKAVIIDGLKSPSDEQSGSAARDNQILDDDDVRRLVMAARARNDDVWRMVLILAATGARFSQVMRLRVHDLQGTRLMMPASRKGKGTTAEKPHIPVPVGADVIAALQPATTGRKGTEPLLERLRMERDGPARWKAGERGAWTSASELTRAFAIIATAAGLPGTVPYALRHSSIVRGLKHGLPIRLVAAIHDTSVAMIERHYGRWIADGLEELAARAIVPMVQEAA